MTMMKGSTSTAAVGIIGAAMALAAPGAAQAQDPCQLGWSNVGPRTCDMRDVRPAPTFTLGNGVCVGMLNAAGVSYDGPLEHYSTFPGTTHSIELRLTQGFSPLGNFAPTLLACDVTAIVDWHNLDTGQTGSVSRFVPAGNTSMYPVYVHVPTGPGRVSLTVRTDRPSVPSTTEVFVP
ncbi:MAG TPA: hypothetical protein VK083_02910 [Nocardia sp.]|uniref:hypothetical protein n=1 Tax=Nocardia TaxID=1817 RepID=UPI002457B8AA|nr:MULTISPECIES: hypothetical protein [Nocardia]HLS75728.1 hypothetical protein [Nocardia sp.]